MAHPIHQIDYAPPTSRPAWWNRRTAFFVVLVLMAIVSGVIVVPRIAQRARLLSLQERLMDEGASELMLVRSLEGQLMAGGSADPTWREYESTVVGVRGSYVVFTGLRQATDTSPERLLVLQARVHAVDPWDTEVFWYIIEPGSWTSSPEVVSQGVARNDLPLPPAGSVVIRSETGDRSQARVVLNAEHSSVPLEGLIVPKPHQVDAKSDIVIHLLPDDTVTIDWKPLSPAPTSAPAP